MLLLAIKLLPFSPVVWLVLVVVVIVNVVVVVALLVVVDHTRFSLHQ